MAQKYWRFDVSNQSSESDQAFIVVEATDQQSAIQSAQQLLSTSLTSELQSPTQLTEQQAQQYRDTMTT